MSNRHGAYLLAEVFAALAENPCDEHRRIAARIWHAAEDQDIDPVEMQCPAALTALGLSHLLDSDA